MAWPVFSYRGRPCFVAGEKRRQFFQGRRRLKWVDMSLTYLDGNNPATNHVSQGRFRAAKPIRGPEGDYWQRVADLHQGGMNLHEARRVAMRDVASGRI